MNWIGYYFLIGLFVAPVLMWVDLRSNQVYIDFKKNTLAREFSTILFAIYILVTVLWLPTVLWDFIFVHIFKDKNNDKSGNIQ